MYKLRSERCFDTANKAEAVYVETDPSGTYGRFRDILGKGAMKTVYKAFDKILGMEVAWNQAKLGDAFHSPMDLQRLYSEVHLLKNLKHDSVMRFYASWIDVNSGTFNFITELFTSGTLREYTQKYQPLNIEAVKNWARQILHGLAYLHSHDPPVIHRDLKCANIFVNGHLGQVKMGDFGLAAVLQGSQPAHSVVGTPEFMAPEIYEEEYNELIDVYSFGMCMIEMLTSEYPYSECSNPAQIYKKVTSGKLPAAFYRIQDLEARKFVGKCLEKVSERSPAKSLLLDPFLAADQLEWTPPRPNLHSRKSFYGVTLSKDHHSQTYQTQSTNMTITGTMNNEGDTIFLKVQKADKNGHTRNIYFPFDIINDTAIEVSMEMVKELDISDWEPLEIAEMIEEEISTLVPTWKNWGTSQFNRQHSFICEDDYDVDDHSDYWSPSSRSSNQGFPRALIGPAHLSRNDDGVYDWLQDNGFVCDETSSQSSMNSRKCAHVNYVDSCMEEGYDEIASSSDTHLCCTPEAKKYTRFCPSEETRANQNHDQRINSWQYGCCNQHPKRTRRRSYVDIRSQLLHRSLMQEINQRRMFKTVGAVENIGFQEPA